MDASKSFGKGQINLPSHPQIAQSVTIGWLCRLTTIEIMGMSKLHILYALQGRRKVRKSVGGSSIEVGIVCPLWLS